MLNPHRFLTVVALAMSTTTAASIDAGTTSLGAYNVDINATSVSGLSSGAYFAVQMAVAFSSTIVGGGIFAGGPYHCAKGSEMTALTTRMSATPKPREQTYVQATQSAYASGSIDDPANMNKQRYYLFSGTKDTTVNPEVMVVLDEYLNEYTSEVASVFNLTAAHTQPTDDPANKNPCTLSASPYLSDCNYDGAGEALNQIAGTPLQARNNGQLSGSLETFDQTEFIVGKSMDKMGYVYVPASCAAGDACTLHISFHGCEQGASSVGTAYVKGAGFNKWADTNNIIVLYPQATTSTSNPSNPNGCWDWWGYNDPSDYDTKTGAQMAAVMAMAQKIASAAAPVLAAPQGLAVVGVTNNSVSLTWESVEDASGYNVLVDGAKASASPVLSTNYSVADLLSGTTYSFAVAAVTDDGAQGSVSTAVQGKTSGPPPPLSPPSGLKVDVTTGNSVSLSWDSAAAGVTGFIVLRDGVSVGTSTTNSYTDSDAALQTSTTYSYQVEATNDADTSSPSDAVKATTTDGYVCQDWYDNNYNQVSKGRATTTGGYCYCVGSGDNLGLYNVATYTTVAETSEGYFEEGSCP